MLDIHRIDSSFLVNSKHGLEGILDFVIGTDSLEEASIDIAQQVETIGIALESLETEGEDHRGILQVELLDGSELLGGLVDDVDIAVELAVLTFVLLEDDLATNRCLLLDGVGEFVGLYVEGCCDRGNVGVVTAEEGELTPLRVQLIVHIGQERVCYVDCDNRSSEEHISIDVLDACDLCPVFGSEVMAEGCLLSIGFFVVLEDEGIGASRSVLEGALHARFFTTLEENLRIVVVEGANFPFLAGGRILEIEGGSRDFVGFLQPFVDTPDTTLTAHSGDLLEGFLLEGFANLRQAWEEDGVHLTGDVAVVDLDVSDREEGGREVASRGDAALHAVGVDVYFVACGVRVFLEEASVDSPLTEVKPELVFQCATARGQFAGSRSPGEPGVCSDLLEEATLGGEWGADVVSAQDNGFCERVLVLEFLCSLLLSKEGWRNREEQKKRHRELKLSHIAY